MTKDKARVSLPLVSVVIPMFNSENTIRLTLESVINQTYPHFEVILVDDGSTDKSISLVSHFKSQVRIIRQENMGVSGARNTGWKASQGSLIAFIDSDDLWLPNKLEEQVNLIHVDRSLGFVFCDAYVEEEKSGKTSIWRAEKGSFSPEDFLKNPGAALIPVASGTLLIRKSILEAIGGFDEGLSISADWDFARRLSSISLSQCVHKPLITYIVRENSMSRSRTTHYLVDNNASVEKMWHEYVRLSGSRVIVFYSIFKYTVGCLKSAILEKSFYGIVLSIKSFTIGFLLLTKCTNMK